MTRTSNSLVIDSWAWLELFSGSERGRHVEQEMADAASNFTTVVTLAEVISVSARRGRPTGDKVSAVRSLSKVVSPTPEDAVEAGLLHAKVKEQAPNLSLADAFALHAARRLGAKVLTGDPDFRGIKDAQLIE